MRQARGGRGRRASRRLAQGEGRARVVGADRDFRDGVRGKRPADRVFDRRPARVRIRLVELCDRDRVYRFSHHAHRHRDDKECDDSLSHLF